MSHLRPDELPYGVYYCRTCGELKPCDVAVGATRADPECPLECLTCGERIGEEVDVRIHYPMPPTEERRQTLTPAARAAGRALVRARALGQWDAEYPVSIPHPDSAPPPGFRDRVAAEIQRLEGRR